MSTGKMIGAGAYATGPNTDNTAGMTSMKERAALQAAGLPIPGVTPPPPPPSPFVAPAINTRSTPTAKQTVAPTRSGRHYGSSFDLTVASPIAPSPTKSEVAEASKPGLSAAQASRAAKSPITQSTRTSGSRTRTGVPSQTIVTPPPAKPARPFEFDDAMKHDALDGLKVREHLFRPEILEEVRGIILGRRTTLTFKPTSLELNMIKMLKVPGF